MPYLDISYVSFHACKLTWGVSEVHEICRLDWRALSSSISKWSSVGHINIRTPYRENWDVGLTCSPTHAQIAMERCCVMAIFHPKHPCPITAVVTKNQWSFSDSAYHSRPEPEPDIESGLQGHLLSKTWPQKTSFVLNSIAFFLRLSSDKKHLLCSKAPPVVSPSRTS